MYDIRVCNRSRYTIQIDILYEPEGEAEMSHESLIQNDMLYEFTTQTERLCEPTGSPEMPWESASQFV